MTANTKLLKKTLEALKASNALSSVTPSLSYAELSEKIAKRAVENWSVKDVRAQKSRYPNDTLVFINKPPKEFNLSDLAKLVRKDAELSRTKFRFVSEDVTMDGLTISPLLRRLLNNGVYYTVFGNTPERTSQMLNNMKLLPIPVQVTLAETQRKDEEPKYREVTPPKVETLVKIEIDKTKYSLSTPSLSLLTRMKGIGVPENHPEHSKLVGVSVPHPLISSFIVFHSIPPTDDKTLLALIPGHVQEHRKYFSTSEPIESPGPILYQDKLYSLNELDEIIAKRLLVTPPLINTAPFLTTKHYSEGGDAITRVLNGEEILDSDKFYHLPIPFNKSKSRSLKSVQLTTRKREYPLSYINSGEVYDMLKFTTQSRMFNVGAITSDMLRGIILDGDVISGDLLNEKKSVLEVLNQAMHWVEQSGFVDQVQWLESLKVLLSDGEDVDKSLVKSLYSFVSNPLHLNQFVIDFANYIILLESQRIYQKGMTLERVQFIKQLMGNVLVRTLQDPMRRLFPEFSEFWVEELGIGHIRTPTLSKNKLTNDWKRNVEFLMESNVKVPRESQHLLDLTGLLYGYPHMPSPYSVQFEVCGIKSDKDKEFLKFVVQQFETHLEFVDEVGQLESRDYLEPIYQSFGVVVVPFRTVPDLTSLNDESFKWCQAIDQLDLDEPWSKNALNIVKNQVRQALKYNEHHLMDQEIMQLNTFLNTRFLQSPNEFQKVMDEYGKKKKEKLEYESFKTVDPEHIEKQINEFI